MQINFYTSPQDEDQLVNYLYGRGCYFIVYKSAREREYPVILDEPLPPAGEPDFRTLNLCNTSIAPVPESHLPEKHRSFQRNQFLGPMGFLFETIEFTRSYTDKSKLYPGRMWLSGIDDQTVRIYQSICRHIRKSYTKNDAGWWVGPTTDDYCLVNKLEKANFAFKTG